MTALAETNGHVKQDVHDHEAHAEQMSSAMDDQIASMRALHDAELKERSHLERLLEESKERERRLTKAIAVLENGVYQNAMSKAAKPAPAPTGKGTGSSKATWHPSEERIQAVWAAFQRYAAETREPFTQTALARWMQEQGDGIASDTIRMSIEALRERELVRKCGSTRGGGKLWDIMPAASHAELEHS